MDLHLTDKIVVVTGAGKGIGLAVAAALAAEGAKVVAGSRQPGEALAGPADVHPVLPVAVDLSTPAGRRRWSSGRSPRSAGSTSSSTTSAAPALLGLAASCP